MQSKWRNSVVHYQYVVFQVYICYNKILWSLNSRWSLEFREYKQPLNYMSIGLLCGKTILHIYMMYGKRHEEGSFAHLKMLFMTSLFSLKLSSKNKLFLFLKGHVLHEIWSVLICFVYLGTKYLTRTVIGWKVYLGSWFQCSHFMISQLYCSGPELRQNIMVEDYGGEKLLSSWQIGRRDGMGEKGRKKPRMNVSPRKHHQGPPSFSQIPPAYSYHPVVYSAINGLTPKLD